VGKWRRAWRWSDEDGSAIVEFLGMSLLLLVPLIYLVLAMSRVQAGAYGAEFAAREAARGATVAGVDSLESGSTVAHALTDARKRGDAVAFLAAEDFGFDPARDLSTSYACSATPCFAPGSDVVATAVITVDLPGVPSFVQSWIPLHVTVQSTSAAAVDGYASGS